MAQAPISAGAEQVAVGQALFERYEKERDKRLRKDGLAQYANFREKELHALARDPWVDYKSPHITNPPLKDGDRIKFLITGGGLNGLHQAGRLVEAGFNSKDIVIVDIAGGFGGTWYWNRYPGLMCDIEGYCYLPFLEETGYMPKHKYSYGAEIRGQIERAASHYGISATPKSETFTVYADFVLIASGFLAIPKIPKLPGWKEFSEHKYAFHTSRWDYNYTGGSQAKPDLVNLMGKRVAILGTGATAVQVVPELAKWASHVYVVQRTPTYVGPRNQKLTSVEDWEKIAGEKGWQNKRRINLNAYLSNSTSGQGPDLVQDGWTQSEALCGFLGSQDMTVTPDQIPNHIRGLHEVDRPRTDLLRKHIENEVKDKATAEKLKPWYGSWCKRPAFNDSYLQSFNEPNVTLIDTNGKGLDGFSEKGIIFDGNEYEIDVLVLATGFVVTHSMDPAEKIEGIVKGRNGIPAADYWKDKNSNVLYGVAMPKFPNLMGHLGRGSGTSYNLTSILEIEAKVIAHVIKTAHEQAKPGQKVIIEPSEKGAEDWANEVAKRAGFFSALLQCTPGWFTNEGAALQKEGNDDVEFVNKNAPWGSGPVDFQNRIEAYIASGRVEGFVVKVVA
ncbi:phenylacetone monooxygenase [Stagonosporopsis vannaccii]|nr:phenylacetone monooxygenase [Stagonosporopsis vannaccii]